MPDIGHVSLRFSTSGSSESDRVENWRELFGHMICGLDIDPLPGQSFQSEAVLRALPGLGVAGGVSSGASYWRPAHLITNDDLVFVINHEGHDLARMSGREEILHPGQAILFAADRVGGTINRGFSRFSTLRIPRSSVARPDDAVLHAVDQTNEPLNLLKNYLGILRDMKALASVEQQRQVVSHVHDLIDLALQPNQHTSAFEEREGIVAARTRAIKSDIARNATSAETDITSIAARHKVTPRYVQMLFARLETSFSDYLRVARLAAAHRMLVADRTKSISDVAHDTGFANVSYFNRAFRREFNATPSDVRWRYKQAGDDFE
jgi:AraC-like DNA-binding protein